MKEPIYFLNVELQNYRSFGVKENLDLSDGNGGWRRWTVILGDNGLGKTSLLQAIASLEIRKRYKEGGKFTYGFRGAVPIKNNNEKNRVIIRANLTNSARYEFSSPEVQNAVCDLEIIGYSSGRGESWSYGGKFYRSSYKESFTMSLYSYGANRVMGVSNLSEGLNDDNSETLFDDTKKLINAEEWLLQLDYAASKESDIKMFAESKRNQVRETLINLLPDVTNIRFTTPIISNLRSSIEFETSFGWFGLHELSLGYKTMIAWMVDLAARMFKKNPESDNPLAEPAIVLIDEIDLHLHPKWQRKMFDYLTEKFPNCQFIVTAHSPLVVQSAPSDVNLVVLRKEGNKVIIDNDISNVKNWRLDQILVSDLFGLQSARSVELEKLLLERSVLFKKSNLSKEEEERLNELNKIVHNIPTASEPSDIEAMEIVRKAADFLKTKSK